MSRGSRASPRPVVLITGAAGGIGAALAWRWGREGARLALLDVDEERVGALSAALRAAGHTAVALPCDVTDVLSCADAVARVVTRFGGVDVLVANAGRTHLSLVAETDADVYRRIMDVNFFGALHVTQAALPFLRERGGRIAVLSSVAGFAPLAGRSGYAASKHALHGLFGSLRGEVAADGVSVTLVCPAFVRTGIGDRALGGDGGPARSPRTELGSPMEPEAVADAVVRAVAARRRLLVLGGVGKASWWAWRLAPWLYEAVMVRRLARAQITSDDAESRNPQKRRAPMVGFSGAVEDGARNVGMLLAMVVSLALGWAYGSFIIGVGAFVAGSLIAHLYAAHAGESFRARQRGDTDSAEEAADEEVPPPS